MNTKKWLYIVVVALMTSGCALDYQPLVDVKASKQPADVQEDQMFCEWLIDKQNSHWFGGPSDEEMLQRCLKGRGVSVIR